MSFDSLSAPLDAGSGASRTVALPGTVEPGGLYTVSPAVAEDEVQWNLGTGGLTTSLPFHVAFKPISLSNPDGTSLIVGSLPIAPILATAATDPTGFPGPGGGPETTFKTYLQPGTYERTSKPDFPFDQAFGPLIEVLSVSGNSFDTGFIEFYDTTTDGMGNLEFPSFDITRAQGTFDGWTAYLRDLNTGDIISNVEPLQGLANPAVRLAVRRVPLGVPLTSTQGDPDALAGAQLVVAPPSDSVEPACLFTPINDFLASPTAPLKYPSLPPPVSVSGVIYAVNGLPIIADLVFEALSITNAEGQKDTTSFEFTSYRHVQPTTAAGRSTFTVVLPPGDYRVDVRPQDPTRAVQVVALSVPVQTLPYTMQPVALGPTQPSAGFVRTADGLPLSNALVQAVPAACADLSLAGGSTNAFCLPRPVQTETQGDGSFVLELDPGSYGLLVQPPSGSMLPWLTETSNVLVTSTGASPAGTLSFPAVSLSVGLRVTDPVGNPVSNALVRMFRAPAQSTPVQIGASITGADGSYEMFVAVPP
ncbi:MAG: hypothetical protein ABSC94_14995 [Polyangiaceae bacterium]